MENLSYIGLSRQIALRSMMDMTANNVANMSTPGFKSQSILLEEALSRTSFDGTRAAQVSEVESYRNMAQGTLSRTGNKLDLAVQGDGYFSVETPAGVKYTRAGNFSLNNNGEIVTSSGQRVLGAGGAPITIPDGAKDIVISQDGTVSTSEGAVGRLQVVSFDNEKALQPFGDNLFDAGSAQEIAMDNPQVLQGMLESSNVQPVLEMNRMVEILRMYQMTQNILNSDHEQSLGMIQKLTRV